MKKKRSSSFRFSLKPRKVFNILAVLASITIVSVIYSNAQNRDYGDYDFQGSGFGDQAFNNLNQPNRVQPGK